jgi:hypothetical protein
MNAFDHSIFPPPFDVPGGTLAPFSFGRYVGFINLVERPAMLDFAMDGVERRLPDDDELAVFAWLCTTPPAEMARAMAYFPGLAIGAATGWVQESRSVVLAAWEHARAAMDECAFDMIPRNVHGHSDAPIPDEDRSFPAGNAAMLHAVAKSTGWGRDFLLWELPLAGFVAAAHSAMTADAAITAPRGYRARQRARADEVMKASGDVDLGFEGMEGFGL